jgi:hypothetical protein
MEGKELLVHYPLAVIKIMPMAFHASGLEENVPLEGNSKRIFRSTLQYGNEISFSKEKGKNPKNVKKSSL